MIFYIAGVLYGIVSGSGLLNRGLGAPYTYFFLLALASIYLVYLFIKKSDPLYTIAVGVAANLVIQLSGGMTSPVFLGYLPLFFIVAFKDVPRDYWIVSVALIVVELTSGIVTRSLNVLPLAFMLLTAFIIGYIFEVLRGKELRISRALSRYEAMEQFFAPSAFESDRVRTAVGEIDRHKGIERPLLYFVKFLHHLFDAHTTAIFACSDNTLVLVQGFSHSELFSPDCVIQAQTGLFHQVITDRKSLLIKEYIQNPDELGYYRGEVMIKSVIIAPIVLIDSVVGVLAIDRKSSSFEERDKVLFDEAANTAGFMLAMLKLYEKARYDVQHLSSIAELAEKLHKRLDLKEILSDTINAFKHFMPCDDISIASVDEVNNFGKVIVSTYVPENTMFSLNDGLVGFVARHRNSIVKDDLNKGNLVVFKRDAKTANASFVGVPIQQDDELLGVVWLEDHQRRKFNDDDVRILNILSYQLSLAWQRAILYDKVKELSIRDGLTDLYNHRHFQEILEAQISEVNELVLMLLDIDHFKKINDTYGHQAGDRVLKFLGRLISQVGIAARYGGEEFAVIMPKCSLKKAMDKAVRMKDQLLKSEVACDHAKIKFTVSIGIAHYPNDARTRVELIEKADRALYQAKEMGRDRIIIAQTLTNQ
ncbi:MAG: diguanylate cyclase [candidate division WOR-3 bacterium]|nr:MAG: diguanylate cyclase [candidate division WOR-3 bacterium]